MRLQPNHPTDSLQGIAASMLDGLLYGSGDAVVGINPASDSLPLLEKLNYMLDDVIQRFAIPTQSCVLTHVTNTLRLIERGAPVDLVFQSIAGTEAANRGFGISLALLAEAQQAALSLRRGTLGDNVMYFETGQGSCLSANAHHGVDQQTRRARLRWRAISPLLINTVVGFIGPEYLYDGKQIIRAGLEDHFCGKLLGLPLGCDVCYTNHAEADQDDMDTLLTLLAAAGLTFLIGVPGADDIMLNYQSTSFHDALYIRELLGLKHAPEFAAWLAAMNITDERGRLRDAAANHPLLLALQENAHEQTGSRQQLGRAARLYRCAHRAGAHRRQPADRRTAALRPGSRPGARRGASAFRQRTAGGGSARCRLAHAGGAQRAADRAAYLRRPDLGRRLASDSRSLLLGSPSRRVDLLLIVADGLSSRRCIARRCRCCRRCAPISIRWG